MSASWLPGWWIVTRWERVCVCVCVHVCFVCVCVRTCMWYGVCKQFLAFTILMYFNCCSVMQLLSFHWYSIWTTLSPSPHTHLCIHTNTHSPHRQLASDKKSQLKAVDHKIRTMEDLFREFRAWLGATDEELIGLSPVARESSDREQQLQETKVGWGWMEGCVWNLNTVWSTSTHASNFPRLLSSPTRFTRLKALTVLV